MTRDSAELRSLLVTAHSLMGSDPLGSGPRSLVRMLDLAVQAATGASNAELCGDVRTAMLSQDPNHPVRGHFSHMLRAWDFARAAPWTDGTPPNSEPRRQIIYRLLDLGAAEVIRADALIPFADLRNINIVIAEGHHAWYVGARRAKGFYWKAYRRYLQRTGWPDESLSDLDDASDLIIERLSDPLRRECWQTKGLVVGYVQSGKTANFTAVVAKAADAGYRLIIVLAGTLDVLRAQTQRRVDKELIGKELILAGLAEGASHDYAADQDWIHFVEHTALPSRLGEFDIERLTGLRDDYRSLRRGIAALEFRGKYEDRPFNHPDNVRMSPVRIVIMKKHPTRIKALRQDLKRLQHTSLGEVPVLIIDDESDQASINTTKPPGAGEEKARTATNREIVHLIGCLPRAQYVGYTATPFANVFIDPADAEDLFPKDFLIGLKRPAGYMGVRDFFDFDDEGRPLQGDDRPPGYASNERAFLRDVRAREGSGHDEDDKDVINLPRAIDSFVLSGALKLFREQQSVSVKLRHHTMLIHRSTARTAHTRDRDLVARVFDEANYGSAKARTRLDTLWRTDFGPVCTARAGSLPVPRDFSELSSFVDIALERIRHSSVEHGPVRVVNAEPGLEEQAPDFDRENVWGILVGGAKLSRGFTVEGLTISYFRRRVRTADTLMQTGRWFGFRHGYHDLVRVFFGRDEPDGKESTFDLQEAFKAICMDEEMFRAQLRRYTQVLPGVAPITPKQVPPLVPQHLLQPSAKNKMYNAVLRFQNYGESWSESTLTPNSRPKLADNARRFRAMLEAHGLSRGSFGVPDPDSGSLPRWEGFSVTVEPKAMLDLLDGLEWADGAAAYVHEREFLRGTSDKDPGVKRWVVLIPQKSEDAVAYWPCTERLKVFRRARTQDARGNLRFNVFSEPRHRLAAEVVAGVRDSTGATEDTIALHKPRTAVMLLYPTVEVMPRPIALDDGEVALGFALYFPANDIKEPLVFGVRDTSNPDAVVVSVDPQHPP
jgi:hypothetical protein